MDNGEWCSRLDHDGDGYAAFHHADCPDAPDVLDCDDDDATRVPGSVEGVDGVDNDCDGAIDQDTVAYDDDGDCACEEAPCAGSVATCAGLAGGDCDDTDAQVSPDAAELPNAIDDDCDGLSDEGTDAYDDDGDCVCEGSVCNGTDGDCSALGTGDCDDTDATVFPEATETADGVDEDCDGAVDDGTDAYDDDGDCTCELGPCVGSIVACDEVLDGDCDDADASVLPGADEICGDQRRNDCDGTDEDAHAACQMDSYIGLDFVSPAWQGTRADQGVGQTLAGVGDVTGDGIGDVSITAFGSQFPSDGVGQVLVYAGPIADTTVPEGAAFVLDAPASDLGFGTAVGSPGDLDGDGRSELLIGAQSDDVAWLSADLDAWPESAVAIRGAPSSGFGASIARLPDLDGDGLAEVLFGAPDQEAGVVYVLPGAALAGATSDLDAAPEALLYIFGESPDDWLGETVADAGDVDGDGTTDLLVGAPNGQDLGPFTGAAYVVSGDERGSAGAADALLRLTGEGEQDVAGGGVAGPGDTDGDGYADVLVSASQGGSGNDHVAYLVFGAAEPESRSLTDADAIFVGIYDGNTDQPIAAAGDVDGDGRPDFAVSAPSAELGEGRVYLIFSPASGAVTLSTTLTIAGSGTDNAGEALAGSGDVTDDGIPDLLIGAPDATRGGQDGAGAAWLVAGVGI